MWAAENGRKTESAGGGIRTHAAFRPPALQAGALPGYATPAMQPNFSFNQFIFLKVACLTKIMPGKPKPSRPATLGGHEKVNQIMESKIEEWKKRYNKQINFVEKPRGIVTFEDEGATIQESVGSVLKDIRSKLKRHARPVTQSDINNSMDFLNRIRRVVDSLKGRKRVPIAWIERVGVHQGMPDEIRDIAIRYIRGEPIDDWERRKLEEYFRGQRTIWSFMLEHRGGEPLLRLVETEHISKDIVDPDSAARLFVEGSPYLDPFHKLLEDLLKIEEVGKGEKKELYSAYAEALQALTLYRYRDVLSDHHYKQLLSLIRERLGKREFSDLLDHMGLMAVKEGDKPKKEVAYLVRHALEIIEREKRAK